jgi:hypothetical protein
MKKAHFRVAWVGRSGSPTEEQIGVELLEIDKDIWGLKLPDAEPDDYSGKQASSDNATKQNSKMAAHSSATHSSESPQADPIYIAEQVRIAVAQLQRVEKLISTASIDSTLLQEFRTAVSHARTTSWAMEKSLGTGSHSQHKSPVAAFINTERVQVASSVCESLTRDFQLVRSSIPKRSLDHLLQSVGDLFAKLANFELEPRGDEPDFEGSAEALGVVATELNSSTVQSEAEN